VLFIVAIPWFVMDELFILLGEVLPGAFIDIKPKVLVAIR